MAIQTVYPLDQIVAFEGMSADGHNNKFVLSAVNVAADSFFGRACLAVAAAGDEYVQPTTVAGTFLGILQHTHSIEQADLTLATAGQPQFQPGNVLRKGWIWVVAEDAVTDVTLGVFYRHTSPGADPEFLGRFRTDLDTADATLVPEARWMTTTSGAGQLAKVEINLP